MLQLVFPGPLWEFLEPALVAPNLLVGPLVLTAFVAEFAQMGLAQSDLLPVLRAEFQWQSVQPQGLTVEAAGVVSAEVVLAFLAQALPEALGLQVPELEALVVIQMHCYQPLWVRLVANKNSQSRPVA